MKIDCTNLKIDTSLQLSEKTKPVAVPVEKDTVDDDNDMGPSSSLQSLKMNGSNGDTLLLGNVVELHGLIKTNHLNGRHGVVSSISEFSSSGRVMVKLFPKSENKEVAVKPENLVKKSEIIKKGKARVEEACHNCDTLVQRSNLMCCSKCKLAVYCNEQCQREHWGNGHKQECKSLRQARKGKQPLNNLTVDEAISTALRIAARLSSKGDNVGSEKILRDTINQLQSRGVASGDLHEHLGYAISEQPGRIEECIEHLKLALRYHYDSIGTNSNKASSTLSNVHGNLSLFLARNGELDESLEHCWKGYELDPSKLHLLHLTGKLHSTMRNYKEGEEAFKMYLSKVGPFDKSKRPIDYNMAVTAYTFIGEMKSNALWAKLNAAQTGDSIVPEEWIEKQADDIRTALHKALEMDPTEQYAEGLLAHLDSQLNP